MPGSPIRYAAIVARHGFADGLQSGETPLVTQFEKGFESVQSISKPATCGWVAAPKRGRKQAHSPMYGVTGVTWIGDDIQSDQLGSVAATRFLSPE
jgi:hypothetical protein